MNAVVRIVHSRPFSWFRHVSLLVVLILIVEYLVLPQLVGASHDMDLLASAALPLVAVALAAEAMSLMSYSALSQVSLSGRRPSYWTLLRIDLTGLGVSHVVPGGGAATVALRYRLLTVAGVSPQDAGAGTAIQTAVSLAMLVVLFVAGVFIALPQLGGHPAYELAGVAGVALLALLAVFVVFLIRRTDHTLGAIRSAVRRAPFLRSTTSDHALQELGAHVRRMVEGEGLARRSAMWGLSNWFFDAVCLWLCLGAYGYWPGVGSLFAVYAAASLLTLLPITPGGLGLVEGVLVPALISFGAEPATALLGVLTWRLMQYWLPIPLAAATYISLRASRLRTPLRTPVKLSEFGAPGA